MDDLQGQIEALTAAQDALLENATVELERILDAAAEDQDDFQIELANLTTDLDNLRSEFSDLAGDLDSQQAENDAFSQKLSASEERMALIEAQWDEELAQISGILLEIQKFKAVELLTRSRYHLVQNNLGLAGQDIQSGYDLLLVIQDEIPEAQAEQYTEILTHLESALANLPQQPVAAADDVDSAWNLLLSDLAD
jgi:chromosome segregation ATPase